jgi:exodeoxyribonuclease V gamma subunit
LLLAQENLWLFYNGFDVSDGEVREPSSVLQELINHIALIAQSETALSRDNKDISPVDQMIELKGIQVPEHLFFISHSQLTTF